MYKFLLLTVIGFALGHFVFRTSYQVQSLNKKIAHLKQEITKENESIRILSAEWSYLNQPDRLLRLAKKYLIVEPFEHHQFVTVDDLPDRMSEEEILMRVRLPKHIPQEEGGTDGQIL